MTDEPNADRIPIDASGPPIPFAAGRAKAVGPEPPPQALDAERALLGAMLIDNPTAGPILDTIPDDSILYDERHRRIIAAIRALYTAGSPIDLISVSEQMKRDGSYLDVGGYYLAELTTSVASSANGLYHAHVVLQKALLRAVIRAGRLADKEASDPTADPFEVFDALDARLWKVQRIVSGPTLRTATDLLPGVLSRLRGEVPTVDRIASTGFPALDAIQGGFYGGAHHVFGAGSGTGKTTLALGMTWDVAVVQGVPAAYFSVEIGGARLTERMVGIGAGIAAASIRNASLLPGDLEALDVAARQMERARIFFDETPRLHIEQVEARLRRLVKHEGVRIAFVDYIQRIGYDGLARDLERGTSIVSGRLKALARELGIAIVSFSQITKEAGRALKKGERPGLNDLRGSEDVGNDADTVGLIYRPYAYGLDADELTGRPSKGWAEVGYPKVRDGEPGKAVVGYNHLRAAFTRSVPFDQPVEEPDLF